MQVVDSDTIIGKIYANWCGHCQTLVPEWDSMKSAIMSKPDLAKKYKFVEIESANQEPRIRYINKHYLKNSATKLILDGYPTLFKIKDGKLSYYKGPRRANDMTNWYTNHTVKVAQPTYKFFGFGGKNATRKRSKKTRKTRNKKHV